MRQNLDQIDRRILNVLQTSADAPLDAIAEKAALSRNACWRRIKRMEAEGVIVGRATLLSPDALNVGLTVFIAVRTDRHAAEWLETFKRAVADMPEIIGVFRMSGDVDYLLQAVVPDMKAYDALYQRIIARVPLSDVSSSFVMEEIKRTTALPLGYA